ncbi:MAG: hypothetical protein R2822_31350 [Spirosomataceae bacterium]
MARYRLHGQRPNGLDKNQNYLQYGLTERDDEAEIHNKWLG